MTNINKMIDNRDKTSDFDEMTAQLASKIIKFFKDDADDDDDDEEVENYENMKDLLRDHLVEWRKKSGGEKDGTSRTENKI